MADAELDLQAEYQRLELLATGICGGALDVEYGARLLHLQR
jgi:hypothetical protein